MKLITILICGLGLLTSMAEQSYAQKTRLTFSMKDVSIKSVLEHIEYNSEFSFMYENSVIDVNRKVNIYAKDEKGRLGVKKQKIDEIGRFYQGKDVTEEDLPEFPSVEGKVFDLEKFIEKKTEVDVEPEVEEHIPDIDMEKVKEAVYEYAEKDL